MNREQIKKKDKRKRLLALLLAFLAHVPILVWLLAKDLIDPPTMISSYGIEVKLGKSDLGLGNDADLDLPSEGNLSDLGSKGKSSRSGHFSGGIMPNDDGTEGGGRGSSHIGFAENGENGLKKGGLSDGPGSGSTSGPDQAGASMGTGDQTGSDGQQMSQYGDTEPGANQGKEFGNQFSDNMRGNSAQEGVSYNLRGWRMLPFDLKKDQSNETGKLTIQFKIDKTGKVLPDHTKTINRTVSLTVARHYEELITKELRFEPQGSGEIPDYSIGTITFLLERV